LKHRLSAARVATQSVADPADLINAETVSQPGSIRAVIFDALADETRELRVPTV